MTVEGRTAGRIPGVAGFYPWARYWAKFIDLYLGGLLIGFTAGAIWPGHPNASVAVALLFGPLLEAVLIALFGTTPGKAAFRISVLDEDMRPLRLGPSIKRSYRAWFRGCGFGIPVVSLFTMLAAYDALKANGRTSWDRGVNYKSAGPTWLSWVALAGAIVVYVVVTTAAQP